MTLQINSKIPPGYVARPRIHQSTYELDILRLKPRRELVAAVEIVSPSNKDRPKHRTEFVGKCLSLLGSGVNVALLDVVTERRASLYAELLESLSAKATAVAGSDLYAVSCRLHNPRARSRL
jgi:hypothetical protein